MHENENISPFDTILYKTISLLNNDNKLCCNYSKKLSVHREEGTYKLFNITRETREIYRDMTMELHGYSNCLNRIYLLFNFSIENIAVMNHHNNNTMI